jgi:hypothetical protein
VDAVYRTGPFSVDLRFLAYPTAAPELYVIAGWLALDTDPHHHGRGRMTASMAATDRLLAVYLQVSRSVCGRGGKS